MKVGDLAMTHRGNLVVIAAIGRCAKGRVDWYDIVFNSSGLLRTGYPANWVRRYKDESR